MKQLKPPKIIDLEPNGWTVDIPNKREPFFATEKGYINTVAFVAPVTAFSLVQFVRYMMGW